MTATTFRGFTSAVVGGVISAALLAAMALTIGLVSAYEAGVLLESIIPTARFLGSSVLTASATTLALMLTLLGLSSNIDERLADAHYMRVKLIAGIDTIAFIGSAMLLVLLVIPFSEANEVEGSIYLVVYYAIVGGSALLGGVMITVVLMIYQTIADMVDLFLSGVDSDLVAESDQVGEESD
jgi:hypothetical protein